MLKIIADIGSNHLGNKVLALELIEAAAHAGADAAKFQLFRGLGSWRDPELEAAWQRNELPAEWIPDLAAKCKEQRIEFLCSIFDPRHIELLNPFVTEWKLASIAAMDSMLLEALRRTGKPVLISTGFMSRADLLWGLNFCQGLSIQATWLYCVSRYPCPERELNLNRFRTLMSWVRAVAGEKDSGTWVRKPVVTLGLSDHTTSLVSGAAAVAMGADILEKHFKLPGQTQGPDAPHSLDPDQFGTYVTNAREAAAMLGSGFWPLALEPGDLRERDAYINSFDRLFNPGRHDVGAHPCVRPGRTHGSAGRQEI